MLLLNTGQQPKPLRLLLPAAELLINKTWTLSSYGFDENGNSCIDMMEERIEECEKDDTYEFFSGGTGIMRDNGFTCCNGIDEQTFQWQFTNNGKGMILSSGFVSIARLTANELVTQKKIIYKKGGGMDLITVYKIKQQHKTN